MKQKHKFRAHNLDRDDMLDKAFPAKENNPVEDFNLKWISRYNELREKVNMMTAISQLVEEIKLEAVGDKEKEIRQFNIERQTMQEAIDSAAFIMEEQKKQRDHYKALAEATERLFQSCSGADLDYNGKFYAEYQSLKIQTP